MEHPLKSVLITLFLFQKLRTSNVGRNCTDRLTLELCECCITCCGFLHLGTAKQVPGTAIQIPILKITAANGIAVR